MLFDWERFTLGTPSIDVGIIVPALPAGEVMLHAAHAYLAGRAGKEDREAIFAREIAAAKVWSVVEFISNYAAGARQLGPLVSRIVEVFPKWVTGLGL